jgi:predicted nucleotide-binding protein (sugar kinase/HSP70/actin superfamily)
MGYLSIAIDHMLSGLGVPYISAPNITKKTVELGSLHSPEGVCLPYKITMGNFIEGIQCGADTLVTICGAGKCRLGFYNTVQKIGVASITDKPLALHTINSTTGLFRSLYNFLQGAAHSASRTAIIYHITKAVIILQTLDSLSNAKNHFGPRSLQPDRVIRIYKESSAEISKCRTIQDIALVKKHAISSMQALTASNINPIKVGIIGEFYVLVEPYVNFELEDMLVRLGVEVKRFVSTGEFVYAQTLLRVLGIYNEETEYLKQARPYMNYHVGGDGLKSVGTALWCAKNGCDGVIHAYPFGCMPEIVAQYALKNISADYNLPMLTLSLDEHSSGVGIVTRIEAFVDCLQRRRTEKNPFPC